MFFAPLAPLTRIRCQHANLIKTVQILMSHINYLYTTLSGRIQEWVKLFVEERKLHWVKLPCIQ